MNAIELENVAFSYTSEPLFSGFSLAIREGEFFGVIGPNGSGKTTLLRLIAGLLIPSAGGISVRDKPLRTYSRRALARAVGFMPQENHFAFDFTVEEVVLMGRNPFLGRFQQPGKADRARADAAMDFADVAYLRHKNINDISGGERQRVVLARTLTQEPRILLLDEPTSHLDIAHQLQILGILRRLNRQGITIVLLAHDLNLASIACTRLLLLDRGRAAACDAPNRVLNPELIEKVYGVRPLLAPHPETGVPQMMLPEPAER